MKSMLIIDGSEVDASLFADFFEKRGWLVVICSDRDSTMNRLTGSEHYDVVLLGYEVPGTYRMKLIRFIRALEQHKMTAVVVVTASPDEIEQARGAGADEVLLMPVNPGDLASAVDKQVS